MLVEPVLLFELLLFGLLLLVVLFGFVESLGDVVVEVDEGFVALLSVGLPTLVEELPVVPEVVELPGLIADEELPVALSVPGEPLPVVPVAPLVPWVLVEPVTPPEVPLVPLVPIELEPVVPMPDPVAPAPVALPPAAPPAAPPLAAPPPAAPPPDCANAPPAARETEARIVAATLPIRMSSIPPDDKVRTGLRSV
ncbi:MAG TPA: hypothetical protein VGH20_03330 [Myxococcales bacterium]